MTMTETIDQPDDTTTEVPAGALDDDPIKKSRGEAAAYRRRLRDTEAERDAIAAERDALRSLLDDRQRGDVEALAGQRLQDGSDIWSTGVDLASLLDDDGEIDTAKVLEHTEALIQSKPHYASPRPDFDLGARPVAPAEHSFADVLRGGRH